MTGKLCVVCWLKIKQDHGGQEMNARYLMYVFHTAS